MSRRLATVKHIVQMGGAEYAKLGTPNNTGTRIVSVSGHVKKPGYYEVEVGKATLGELIFHENFGGGLRDGPQAQGRHSRRLVGQNFQGRRKIQAEAQRGRTARWPPVDVDMLDLPYDFDSLQQAGSMSGSGAIIVMDDSTDIVAALANIADFYAHESCGQCTPCREGSLWMAKALHRMTSGHGRKQDADYLLNIAQNIQGRTICAFGEACAWPVLSFVNNSATNLKAAPRRTKPKQRSGPGQGMKIAASPRH